MGGEEANGPTLKEQKPRHLSALHSLSHSSGRPVQQFPAKAAVGEPV